MQQDDLKNPSTISFSGLSLDVSTLVEAMEDGVCIQTPDHKIVQANKVFAKILSLTLEEIIGRSCSEVFSASHIGQIPELCHLDHELKEEKEEVVNLTTGQRLRIRVSPIQIGSQIIAYLIIIRDIADVIQRERELARAEQLSLIGELVAGLAHEIRNPLTGIQGAMDILIGRCAEDNPDRKVLQNVRQEVWRIDSAINSLLERSRLRATKITPASLKEVAKTAVMLAQDQITATMNGSAHNIELVYDAPSDPMIIPMDAGNIEDAILNLILNAIEAIDKKGRVTISLKEHQLNDTKREVIVEVKDNGRGIPPEHLSKIFNPFFSTKSNGTGLGLAAVRRILRAHSGHVDVTSKLGEGSIFRLYLPG
jgi:PAS domain S-box-containing protein